MSPPPQQGIVTGGANHLAQIVGPRLGGIEIVRKWIPLFAKLPDSGTPGGRCRS